MASGNTNGKRSQSGAQRAPGAARKRTAASAGRSDPNPLRFSLWFFFGFLIVVLDQATKFYFERALDPGDVVPVLPGFNFVLAHNRGAAFSFLADAGGWQRWFFTILAAAVVVFVLRLLWKHGGKWLFSLSLTLIAAGAAGNLIDRALSGYVVDFIDLYWQTWHWPAFNVADIAICTGAAGLVLDELLGVPRDR